MCRRGHDVTVRSLRGAFEPVTAYAARHAKAHGKGSSKTEVPDAVFARPRAHVRPPPPLKKIENLPQCTPATLQTSDGAGEKDANRGVRGL